MAEWKIFKIRPILEIQGLGRKVKDNKKVIYNR
jgi:hypothetical protein